MSIEQQKNGGEEAETNEASHIQARNMMQIELAKRHCAGRSHKEMGAWLSETLSPRFHALIERRPELLGLYEKDPEAALAEAEKELQLGDAEDEQAERMVS